MSLNRINFRLRRLIRHAIPCWICIIIFFSSAFLAVLLPLRHQEQEKAREQLRDYLSIYQQKGSTGLQRSYATSGQGKAGFLRLEGENLRLILVTNTIRDKAIPLPDFSTFPCSIELVWHALQPGNSRGPWTVAATTMNDGSTLQIGIDSSIRRNGRFRSSATNTLYRWSRVSRK